MENEMCVSVLVLVVSLLAATIAAHPEAGYSYNGLVQQQQQPQQQQQQQQQHQQQQHQSQLGLSPNGHSLTAFSQQQLPTEHSFAGFGSPAMAFSAPLPAAPMPAAPPSHMMERLSGPIVPEDLMQQAHGQQDSYHDAYQHSSMGHASGYAYAPQVTQVLKHIYVHVPPKDFDEEDSVQPHVRHQPAPKQKHYKIVFIKAPAAPSLRPPVVAPAPQSEEKTLIYVLHKKPETDQDIVIPTPAPTKPSKPEVYFIKYKTKKEEAPVYGPPPAPSEARNSNVGPTAEEYMPLDAPTTGDLGAPMTTMQPPAPAAAAAAASAPAQGLLDQGLSLPMSDLMAPSEVYGAPTMPTFGPSADELQAPAATPSNQYLAPDPTQITLMAPTVATPSSGANGAEEVHMPSPDYGPPNRFNFRKQ